MKTKTKIKVGCRLKMLLGDGEVKHILKDGIVISFPTGDEIKYDFDELKGVKQIK